MSENSGSSGGSGLGCLAPAVGIASLVATLMLGPVDLGRSVYNGITGDTPVLKEQLLDYSRRDIKRKNPNYTNQQAEVALADELHYKFNGSTEINPQKVSVERLWDASEDHARTWYERWVWPSLEE
jgi:hypothetical protein